MSFEFEILGRPVPKGSRVAGVTKTGHRFNREANSNYGPYVADAKKQLLAQLTNVEMIDGPVELLVEFTYERPKKPSHEYPSRGDLDKLVRTVGDLLQHVGVIKNDSQITRITAEKRFGHCDRVVGEVLRIL